VLGLTLEVFIILALILFNGVLAMSELAVVSSRRSRLQQRAEAGDHKAQRALLLAEEPTRFLSTVQIGITLVGILAGAFGGARIAGRVSNWLIDAGLSEAWSDTLGVALVVIVITYLSLIFGELVPKRIALHSPERIAGLIAGPMQVLSTLGSPFVTLLSASTGTVLRLIGLGASRVDTISEEELRLMIGMSAESGTMAEHEAELLDRVFHFGDRHVHEVMTPRTEAVGIEKEATLGDFYAVYRNAHHSRFPVYDESLDSVVGILVIKDVLTKLAAGEIDMSSPVEPLARQALFVPETKLIGELFREMQVRGDQMAIAIDEFGGTAGIVTLEQLLEEMVGQVRDELWPEEKEITTIDERTTQVDGSLSIEEAREELALDIPEGDYDTVAGYVLSELGHIPKVGESVTLDGCRIMVAEMRGLKIELLRVIKA
jgi:putative hemolysin